MGVIWRSSTADQRHVTPEITVTHLNHGFEAQASDRADLVRGGREPEDLAGRSESIVWRPLSFRGVVHTTIIVDLTVYRVSR